MPVINRKKTKMKLQEKENRFALQEKIVKDGDQYCVVSADGKKKMGCYGTEGEAAKRLRQVEYFRNQASVNLPLAAMESLCPSCATEMKRRGLSTIKIGDLLESKIFMAVAEQGFSQGLCDRMGGFEGFRTTCMEAMAGEVDDVGAFCNALKEFCFGSVAESKRESLHITNSSFAIEMDGKEGRQFDVVLIAEGFSSNLAKENGLPVEYTKELLSNPKTIDLFEGALAKAYDLNGSAGIVFDHLPEFVRKRAPGGTLPAYTVGYYDNVHYGAYAKPDGALSHGILATFHVLNENIKTLARTAWEAGRKDIFGFSIDADAVGEVIVQEGKSWNRVLEFINLPEVTLVDSPAAGGQLLALKASYPNQRGDAMNIQQLIGLLRLLLPEMLSGLTENANEAEQTSFVTKLFESEPNRKKFSEKLLEFNLLAGGAVSFTTQPPPPVILPPMAMAGGAASQQQNNPLALIASQPRGGTTSLNVLAGLQTPEAQTWLENLMRQSALRAWQSQNDAETARKLELVESTRKFKFALEGAGLPLHMINEALAEYDGFPMRDNEIARVVGFRKKSFESLRLQAGGAVSISAVQVTKDQEQKYRDAMYAALMNKVEHNGTPAFINLSESYRTVTGKGGGMRELCPLILRDLHFGTSPKGVNQNDWTLRLRERRLSLSLQEDTLISSLWAEVTADTMHRAVLDYYVSNPWTEWQTLVSEMANANDFRPLHRIRIGGFADYDDVPEGAPYAEQIWPKDDEESFAVGKKGNIFPVSFETIRNDDIGALRKVVKRIGVSGARSIYKTVTGLLQSNPLMSDGFAVFSTQHLNLHTNALSTSGLQAGIQLMHDQLEPGTTEVLGNLEPKYILMPSETYTTAWELTNAAVSMHHFVPGAVPTFNTRSDTVANIFTSRYGIIPQRIPTFTDANDWILMADPNQWDTIAIAFLDGKREPEILVADQQNIGSFFTADVVNYKARLIFAAKIVSWIGMNKAVVV